MAIKKIVVLGEELCIRTEGIAAGVITPGHLVEGPATDIVVHSGATLTAAKKFAYENEVVGNGIDDDYADNDTVLLVTCPPGSIVYAIAGTGGVTAEAFVDSLGDGRLGDVVTDPATDDTQRASVVGKAIDTATVGLRFRCEIL
jgi:hypothetical protein